MSQDKVSLEEVSAMFISLIDWIGRAEAANQMAMIKAHEIMAIVHKLKKK